MYTGGKLFANFLGDGSEDGFYPEEWIASAVRAMNKESANEKEGVSKPIGYDLYFDDLLSQNKYEMLGPKGKMRILVKFLDSAVRLPAQVHPDREFSRTYLHSEKAMRSTSLPQERARSLKRTTERGFNREVIFSCLIRQWGNFGFKGISKQSNVIEKGKKYAKI